MSSPNLGPIRGLILINAQSADETQSQWTDVRGYDLIAFYVQGDGTTSSGVLTIETCSYDPLTEKAYGGTASAVTTVNASDVTGGAQKMVALTSAAYAFLRARITTEVGGGGTITVRLEAH